MQKIGIKKNIDGISINIGNRSSQLDDIINISKDKKGSYICVANVQMFVTALKQVSYKNVLAKAEYVVPDGVPLCWLIKYIFKINQSRVAGIDIFPILLKLAQRENLSVLFCGGTQSNMDILINKVKFSYNNLVVLKPIIPPMDDVENYDYESIILNINNSNPNLIFVSLGCPKQEIFMSKIAPHVNSTLIGVGAAFPYYIKKYKRSPKWAQDNGLEWVFRIINEPRLLKRYFVTNTYFIYYIIKKIIKRGINWGIT